MPSRRLPVPAVVAVTALVVLALAPGAAPLAAYLGVETFRGSHCHPSHFNGETEDWAYEGANLVNRGSGTWDVLIASCPVNAKPTQPVASSRIFEIRVVVDGATFSNGWCNLIDWQGVERSMRVSSTNPEWFFWAPPASSGVHSRDFTVRCLLLPDWELERIEVVWSW
jgi:hypothetical protein